MSWIAWNKGLVIGGLALVLLAAVDAADAAESCTNLSGQTLAPSLITLPTGGARVISAEMLAVSVSAPELCKVLGEIKPVDVAAPPIKFEVNLPTSWNGRMIQYGGGGLNGVLVTAIAPLRDAPPGLATPLMRGYATFGADSGHQNDPAQVPQAFTLNGEALVNMAYASYKKTYDVALRLASTYYETRPSKVFFIGGSEGGREALLAAQKFPADYDGVIATVPVLSWTGASIAGYRQWQAMMDGGWMSLAKVALVQGAVLAVCDKLDGAEDGVVARYQGCNASPQLNALRCPNGNDTGESCLSDKQLALVRVIRSPYHHDFSLAHGERDHPAFPVGGEANPGAYVPVIVPPKKPASDDSGGGSYAVGNVRYFIAHDPLFRRPLDEREFKDQITKLSALMDMNNPDLSAFAARGGKLIIKENGADYTIAPASVFKYYDNVVRTMGRAKAETFIRLYVAPGTQHNGQGVGANGIPVPDKVDLLTALEQWVDRDKAPADQLLLASYNKDGQAVRAWPMCRYGAYPHYRGYGDINAAESYMCRPLR